MGLVAGRFEVMAGLRVVWGCLKVPVSGNIGAPGVEPPPPTVMPPSESGGLRRYAPLGPRPLRGVNVGSADPLRGVCGEGSRLAGRGTAG